MAEIVDKGVRTCYNIVAYKSLFVNFAGGGKLKDIIYIYVFYSIYLQQF